MDIAVEFKIEVSKMKWLSNSRIQAQIQNSINTKNMKVT